MASSAFIILGLVAQLALGQTPGNITEVHPKLDTYRCTVLGGCKKQTNYLVLESSTHPIHQTTNSFDCGSFGSKPNATACPDAASCAKNCIIEGIPDYRVRGVSTSGDELRLQQIYNGNTVSPRVYLLEENKDKYDMMYLTGQEFSFDVDMAKLPCGMNSAIYFSEMAQDGGKSLSPYSKAGARYGTGYCDAQCFVTPFINGVGNVDGRGSCCNELDIWEANSRSTLIAPHTCNKPGLYECTGDECNQGGVCDKSGCAWNEKRYNITDYYGRGNTFKVDTTRKFTVVTQFVDDAQGYLTEMHRHYIQDNQIIQSATVNIDGPPKINYINDEFCSATGFSEFLRLGGMKGMGESMTRGMVLVMSLYWDQSNFMSWLDQGNSGPCNATEGSPESIQKIEPNPEVTFSNIRVGEINSTFSALSSYKARNMHKREAHLAHHLQHHKRQRGF